MRYLSRFLQPDTLPATTPPAADYMVNSSDVLRRVHSKWHASTMFCMSCKGGAACRNEHNRAARETEASDNGQVNN